MYRVWNLLEKNSQFLLVGAVTALIWANVSPGSYHALVDFPLLEDGLIGHLSVDADGHAHRTVTLHYLINDVLMALFFAVAGKEVWEAVALRGGALRGRKAITPLIATAGGMLGPIAVYLVGAALLGKFAALADGWAIPTATDIAFSYLVGRLVFGAGHPAVKFLLLLAIADDAGGLLILATFYPQGNLKPEWLILSLAATLATYFLVNRLPRVLDGDRQDRPVSTIVRQKLSFWPYLIAGILSWFGFQQAGIHPALGLLPIIPAIPHSDIEFGIFAKEEEHQTDLLNWIEHRLKAPIQIVLLLFGVANAGVEFSVIGEATWLVFAGLIIGKPSGILLLGWFAARPLGLGLPEGMRMKDLFVLGCVAAIGFTVSLFVAGVAFPPGQVQDAAKMGALFSFAATAIAIVAGKIAGVERRDLPVAAPVVSG
ncbi:sodium:proton antiporter [Phyllobacterium brassicacearum]|uniref:Na(+)/H(+) antiporter NhaA n=1 Tax=Phyllobacterium brassicacearum TaxID=314235 RepID=A0A2P7BP42_9HYPH|nr:Na+/H+ antiporter NhaA [Phyllobacterium brassicacearum]PSH68240.1 sodium:proton antiporter [Phyllobacterium brassicacearum]TDQ29512.1 sodium/proton antiporter (NhaA family) [Phyllobacterium brassicacearum]